MAKTLAAATWEPIESLKIWEQNPRRNDEAVEPVARSIATLGFGAPIVARLDGRQIIAGHTRLKAMAFLDGHVFMNDGGWRKRTNDDGPFIARDAPGPGVVPVRLVDVTETEAKGASSGGQQARRTG